MARKLSFPVVPQLRHRAVLPKQHRHQKHQYDRLEKQPTLKSVCRTVPVTANMRTLHIHYPSQMEAANESFLLALRAD